MRLRRGWIATVLVVAGLLGPACTRASEEEAASTDIASVQPIQGSEVARVTLSPDAARRLDVRTALVRELPGGGGKARLAIPYSAVLYDPNGETWVYSNPQPLVFVRAPIEVDHIEGSLALLSAGPPAGTQVVTVGASELLGTEYEVGEE